MFFSFSNAIIVRRQTNYCVLPPQS